MIDRILLEACDRHGPRLALADGTVGLAYRDLAGAVVARQVHLDAALATAGLSEVDRLGIYAHNSIDYVISYFAALRTGRVPMLIDAQFGRQELTAIRDGCGALAFITDRSRSAAFPVPGDITPIEGSEHDLVTLPDEPATGPAFDPATAVCRFTSGTTGVPKCLEFSGHAVINAATNWIEGTGLTAEDRTLCLAAMTNGLAFNTSLLSSFIAGAALHLFKGLPTSDRIVRALGQAQPTRLVAFPMVYQLLAESEVDDTPVKGLAMAISAGAALPVEVRAAFEQRYEVRIADYYGIAEVGPCTFERDPAVRAGLGTALPGVTLRTAVDEQGNGEIHLRTASMATRYLNAPGLLESRLGPDGFYATGDLGQLRDGRLFLTGRLGGAINLGGRKIDPTEVEQVARAIDGVADAVVLADQDVNRAVVLHLVVATTKPLTRRDIVAGCQTRLAPYKVPQKITFLAEIPRSAAGKLRRTDLDRLLTTTRDGGTA